MSEAVDVGSVLGGRYKVTAYVLASAEKDLVLEGVDQVLNRPVSILVASERNASRVTATARELASGERNENIQVLDLSITDSGTYLVTNRAPAADMLDLIVQREVQPETDAPFVEPFFTDTLGSELFGQSRSSEPENYDDDHDYDTEDDDEYEERRPSRLSGLVRRFGRRDREETPGDGQYDDSQYDNVQDDDSQDDDARDAPAAAAAPLTARSNTHSVPPPPVRRPGGAPSASGASAASSVTSSKDGSLPAARAEHDHDEDQDDDRRFGLAGAAAAAGSGAASQHSGRAASYFPLSDYQDEDPDGVGDAEEYDEYEDGDGGGRRFTRLLVGAVLTIGIIVAVVIAATTLGGLNDRDNPVADPSAQATSEPAAPETTAAPATPPAPPAPEPVQPVISDISRVVPDNQALDAVNDVNLPLIIDGDPTTFWGNQVYASETFGGLASSLALVVELEEESTVSEVSITQLNGSGGTFTVLLNDQPTLEGAEQVAQAGFTAPTVTVPVPEGPDGQQTAQYVIVNFTQLPRLDIQAPFPFGVRIAEIDVS